LIQKALKLTAALAALAAAAAVCVVAAAYAVYALLRYSLTPAGSAAVVALIFAVLAAVIALVLLRRPGERSHRRDEPQPTAARLIELARERPILAAGAAVAAGLVLLRNPKLIATAATAAMAGRAAERSEHRRSWF
jgi:ABC-type nickel/cobalt efflux system permease component RcnA